MSSFFRSMGRSSRPKKSPTHPSLPFSSSSGSGLGSDAALAAYAPASPGSSTQGKALYMCSPFIRSALIKGSFKTIVALPKYVDEREWLAVNCECVACASARAQAPDSKNVRGAQRGRAPFWRGRQGLASRRAAWWASVRTCVKLQSTQPNVQLFASTRASALGGA
jgi:hypothetical protein